MDMIRMVCFCLLISFTLSANAQQEAVICHTQLLVATPQTVGFYLGTVTKNNFVGYANVGQWLRTYAVCLTDQYVRAVVWDSQGRKHVYKSKEKYNNVNSYITLIYPQDFDGALAEQADVVCRLHLLNNSAQNVSFYVKSSFATHKLITLNPWQTQIVTSPCFSNEEIIARTLYKNKQGLWQEEQRYKSEQKYTDINTVPYLSFPDNFKETMTFSINWH